MDLDNSAGLKSPGPTPDVDIRELPQELRRDAWRDFMSDFWRDGRPLVANQDLELSVASRQLDNAVFCQLSMSPAELVGNHYDFDCFVVRYQSEGKSTAIVNGEQTEIRPGTLTVMDLSATRYSFSDWSKITYLAFKKSALQSEGRQLRSMTHFDGRTPIGRLMIANFQHLAKEVMRQKNGDVSDAVDLFSSLVVNSTSDVIALQSNDTNTLKAKRIRAERVILAHPMSQPLNVEQLCTEVGMSRATLYRLFREEGGLKAYITKRRLDRAYRQLAICKPGRGVVTLVAGQAGFQDVSRFSRDFRREYGCTPSEIVGSAVNRSSTEFETPAPLPKDQPRKANPSAQMHNPFYNDLDTLAKRGERQLHGIAR